MVITANTPKFDKRQPSKGAYDAIVYIDGSQVIAEDSNGRKIASGVAGTDDLTVLLSVLSNDSSILVCSDLVLTSGVRLNSLSNCHLTALPGVTITRNISAFGEGIRIIKCDDISISGFKFTQSDGRDDSYFITIAGSNNVNISHNVFYNFFRGINMYVYDSVRASLINIIHNEFYDYKYSCVIVGDGCDDVLIDSNSFHDSIGVGIGGKLYAVCSASMGYHDPVDPVSTNIRVCNNTIKNHGAHNAIDLHGGNRVHVRDNDFYNVANFAIYMHNTTQVGVTVNCHNWLVDGNIIELSGYGIGIYTDSDTVSGVYDIIISNNEIKDCFFNAINVMPGSVDGYITGVHVFGNTIRGHIGDYAYAEAMQIGSTGKVVTDCVVSCNTINCYDEIGFYYGIYTIHTVNSSIKDNYIQNCVYAPIFDNSSSGLEICANRGYIAPGEPRSSSGLLTAGNANAIAFAWHNPESQDILIKKITIRITTPGGTAGSLLDVGIADDATGTNLGAEFFDDLDLNTAGTSDQDITAVFCQDSVSATDGWVVGKILAQNAGSLVGSYYIEYMGA